MSIATGDSPIGEPIELFILQLLIIVILSKFLAFLLHYIKQPQVIAEIICGIVLGPSVLGNIPGYLHTLFPPSSLITLNVVANIGLIFFMFLVGVELDLTLLKNNAKQAIIIAASSMVLPFAFGAVLSLYLITTIGDSPPPLISFLLFVGVAMSITALPIMARILSASRSMTSRVGIIALSSAAVNDVAAWILLAVVVSIARAQSSLGALYTLLMLFGYIAIMYFLVRPLLVKLVRKAERSDAIKHQVIVLIFLITLVSGWITEAIGINYIFGGFMMGIVTPRENGFSVYITERIEDPVIILFLPLYFTYSGLRTNLGSLDSGQAWGNCILVIVITCIGKICGATAATRFLKNTWRESFTVGILMNTKGLIELIVLNLGLDVGVLTPQLFTMFVLMALFTTMITSPGLYLVWTRHEAKRSFESTTPGEKFSVLMCVSDQHTGMAMTALVAVFKPTNETRRKRKKFKATALHLKEVTDQPSTFMFSHSTHQLTTPFLPFMQERAALLGLPSLKVVEMASSDIADDITYYVKRKHVDLVLLGWNERLFGIGGGKVRSVLSKINASVGVLVDRGLEGVSSRVSVGGGVGGVKNILLFYTGFPYQRDALKLCRRISQHEGTNVTVVSNLPEDEIPGLDSHFRYIYSDDPLPAAIEESKNQLYNLIIIGISRYSDDELFLETSHLISLTRISILLVHAKEDSSSKENEKTRLFLNSDDTNGGEKKGSSVLKDKEMHVSKKTPNLVVLEIKPGDDDIDVNGERDDDTSSSTKSIAEEGRDVVELGSEELIPMVEVEHVSPSRNLRGLWTNTSEDTMKVNMNNTSSSDSMRTSPSTTHLINETQSTEYNKVL